MSEVRSPGQDSPSISVEEWQELAVQVLKACGYGRMLIVGLHDVDFLSELLRHGVDVKGVTGSSEAAMAADVLIPGRVSAADSAGPLCLDVDEPFDTVVFFADSATPRAWAEDVGLPRNLVRAGRSVLMVVFDGINVRGKCVAWDERFFAAGARRHPLAYEVAPYGALDSSPGKGLLLYEAALGVNANGGLPDCGEPSLLGFGSASEARAARYALAGRYVRPGDKVIDVFSGCGDGAYLLSRVADAAVVGWRADARTAARTKAVFPTAGGDLRFEVASRTGFSALPSSSIDFIVADGALDGDELPWTEAKRALTPGGRIYVCVPVPKNAAGNFASGLRRQLDASGFLLEEEWLQRALPPTGTVGGRRMLEKMLPDSVVPAAGDWIVLLAMKSVVEFDPRLGQVAWDTDIPNVVAFARDYYNPWLVRGLVAIGLRATSVGLRAAMADEVLANSQEDSADFGAALCVRCYAALERNFDAADLRVWLRMALAFSENPEVNPTVARWQISLMFVAGTIAQKIGDLELARSIFATTGSQDALKFSPLLGTKTVGAAFRCGVLAFASGDKDSARSAWKSAVCETQRLLREGDWREILVDFDRPETFGLIEVASLVMEGARAASGLRALRDYPGKPSLVWQALHNTLADVVSLQDLELRSIRRWGTENDRGTAWLEQQLQSWQTQAREKDEQVQLLIGQLKALDEGKAWIEKQLSAWQTEAREKDEQVQLLIEQLKASGEGKAWIENQLSSWQADARNKEGQIDAMRAIIESLNGENAQLLVQREQSELRVEALRHEIRALAKSSVDEHERLRSMEASMLVRFGRKLGLIRIKAHTP